MIEGHTAGLLLEYVGTLMIGFSVIRVHTHIGKEHKIDKDVIASIKNERKMVTIGLVLITAGLVLQLVQ